MKSSDNARVKIKASGKDYYVEVSDLMFDGSVGSVRLGDILDLVYDDNERLSAQVDKLQRYIEVEAQAQKLIANAHDALALKLTQANERIDELENKINSLEGK
jgi:hypothetical protein